MTEVTIMRTFARVTGIVLAVGALTTLMAAGTAIGMALANGGLSVNHSQVRGNMTLFDGSLVETATGYSQLLLDKGVQVRLAAESRATVHAGRLVLEAGQGDMESAGGYEVEARTLLIRAAVPGTQARIRLAKGNTVTVAAVHGAVRVSNGAGVLVARIDAGNALNFEPQPAGAAAPTRASGCLLVKSGSFILAERTNNVVLELIGNGMEKELGNQVEITGKAESVAPHIADASQVIKVAGIRQVSKGGCGNLAKKLGAVAAAGAGTATAAAGAGGAAGTGAAAGAAGAGAATATGIGAGTVAVIGGVATAATVGGLAAAGSLPGQGESSSQASR
jgi:hypothetical protein